jgi:hypothetical protein
MGRLYTYRDHVAKFQRKLTFQKDTKETAGTRETGSKHFLEKSHARQWEVGENLGPFHQPSGSQICLPACKGSLLGTALAGNT